MKRLAALISGQRIDIVASFLFHANVVARLARPLARPRPHLVTSIRIADERRPWRLLIERASARAADRVVCVSDSVRLAADPSGANDRYSTIYNGVPIPAAPADLRADAPWACVARLDPQKGHDAILGAWRALGARAPRLRLVGGGPLLERIRGEVARDGLPIDLLGPRDDVPAILAESGGFVLASREEGLSNALLEAMAAGLPCVATDVGGAREALDDGRAGILIPHGDARALARAIADIAGDPTRARSLAAAARTRAESEFPVHRMIDRWAALLTDLQP